MALKDQINDQIKKAMLAKNKERLRALRAVKSLILLAESEKGSEGELSEDKEMELLMKAVKQRKESAAIYEEQNRPELKETEEFEISVLEEFLPKQVSDEELKAGIEDIIARVGAASPKDMGKVMGPSIKKFAGQAEGKRISDMVKQLLNA